MLSICRKGFHGSTQRVYGRAIPIAKIIGWLERSKVEPFWKEAPPE
jgi:hypothetical protein